MPGVTVVSPSDELETRLLGMYDKKSLAVRRVWSDDWREPRIAVQEICAANPAVVAIAGIETADAEVLVSELDRRHPELGVLVIDSQANSDEIVGLLRSGARDVVTDSSDDGLQNAIDVTLQLAAERRRSLASRIGLERRVVVVTGPKGGAGKTTFSTNLAYGVARRHNGRALLIDLDLQFGDTASTLGIEPKHSLVDAAALASSERSALKVFLEMHTSSLAVLAAPLTLADADQVSTDDIKRVMAALIEEFPFVVVDTAAGIDDAALTAMEFATDIVMVCTPEVPAVRAAKRSLDALDSIGMHAPRRHFVVNRAGSRVGLTTTELEETVGMNTSFEIPSTRSFPIASNEGVPLLQRDPRDRGARPLQEAVDFFAPVPPAEDTGALNRFFRRKEG
ncbi:MAG: AAA family ATPase [Acidimicrobiales bacterium]|nr:AAA family ATPase [Acidimicrobiales bacterium]